MVERFHNLVCVCDGEDHDDRKTEKVAQEPCVFTRQSRNVQLDRRSVRDRIAGVTSVVLVYASHTRKHNEIVMQSTMQLLANMSLSILVCTKAAHQRCICVNIPSTGQIAQVTNADVVCLYFGPMFYRTVLCISDMN